MFQCAKYTVWYIMCIIQVVVILFFFNHHTTCIIIFCVPDRVSGTLHFGGTILTSCSLSLSFCELFGYHSSPCFLTGILILLTLISNLWLVKHKNHIYFTLNHIYFTLSPTGTRYALHAPTHSLYSIQLSPTWNSYLVSAILVTSQASFHHKLYIQVNKVVFSTLYMWHPTLYEDSVRWHFLEYCKTLLSIILMQVYIIGPCLITTITLPFFFSFFFLFIPTKFCSMTIWLKILLMLTTSQNLRN